MNAAQVARAAALSAEAGDAAGAWQAFAPLADQLGINREVALAFTDLLHVDASTPETLAWCEQVARGFRTDHEVIIRLTAGLVRAAEHRPPDEPPFVQGPAHLAAGACQACFESLSADARMDPAVGGYLQINMADALRMMGPDYDDDALKAYTLALTIDDTRAAWWFQLGLLHKWRGRFSEGLRANQKAFARLGGAATPTPNAPTLRAVAWNIAICATALGEGKLALEAWRELGIQGQLSSGGMPFVPDMPQLQVRVATVGEDSGRGDPLPPSAVSFEVLWVAPLSPCHGVLQTPTARKASVDYGDVVLWDGAPVLVHEVNHQAVPVFPLLWILRPGDERRLRFVGMCKGDHVLSELRAALSGLALLSVLDERVADSGQRLFYGKLIVPAETSLAHLRSMIERALSTRAGLTLAIPQLYELLKDTPHAGKAHQAWGGIERAAQKLGLLPSPSHTVGR